jgi:hypothetical protein
MHGFSRFANRSCSKSEVKFARKKDKAYMKRLVITTVLKLIGEAVLITIIAGIAIGILGNYNKWDTSVKYSDAFFIAGGFMIIAGGVSRLAAGQERDSFQRLNAESFRDMSVAEQADFVVAASSSVRLVILGILSGILLILISALLPKLF